MNRTILFWDDTVLFMLILFYLILERQIEAHFKQMVIRSVLVFLNDSTMVFLFHFKS